MIDLRHCSGACRGYRVAADGARATVLGGASAAPGVSTPLWGTTDGARSAPGAVSGSILCHDEAALGADPMAGRRHEHLVLDPNPIDVSESQGNRKVLVVEERSVSIEPTGSVADRPVEAIDVSAESLRVLFGW